MARYGGVRRQWQFASELQYLEVLPRAAVYLNRAHQLPHFIIAGMLKRRLVMDEIKRQLSVSKLPFMAKIAITERVIKPAVS